MEMDQAALAARATAIKDAWDNDARVVDIAAEHGISIPRVYQIVSAVEKGPGKPGRPRKVDPAEVVAAIKAGARQIDVAIANDISRGRVTQILNEHAPELVARLREERGQGMSKSAINRRIAKALSTEIPPRPVVVRKPAPAEKQGRGVKRPDNWKAETADALKTSKTKIEAAAKLGISPSALRKRLLAMSAES